MMRSPLSDSFAAPHGTTWDGRLVLTGCLKREGQRSKSAETAKPLLICQLESPS